MLVSGASPSLSEESKVTVEFSQGDFKSLVDACRSASLDRKPSNLVCAAVERSAGAAQKWPRDASRVARASAELSALPAPPPPRSAEHNFGQQRWFIRADNADNFNYALFPTATGAKGASISYTSNRVAATQSASVNGLVSYLLIPPKSADLDNWGAFALAAWTSANGNWSAPFKKPENNSLKAGLDAQIDWSIGQNDLYTSVAPYFLTDFRDQERAGGVRIAVSPVVPAVCLGGCEVTNNYLANYWVFRPEVDIRQVTDPGQTNFVKGGYQWVGYTLRDYLYLFPKSSDVQSDPWLVNRLSLIGTIQDFHDLNSSAEARMYSASLQYVLGECANPTATPAPGIYPYCKLGSSSISLEYAWGTDKDTLVAARQYLVKLNYSY